ncbi:cell surface protein SprA [candidate division KSB1 bacterium]|nr:cell surface protein SprA [candidate division KSB1 bacterium]
MISIFFSSSIIFNGEVFAANDSYLGLRLPATQQYGIPLFTKKPDIWMSMTGTSRPFLETYPGNFKRNVVIDSTASTITIEENIFDTPLHLPAKYPLKDYVNYCRQENNKLLWQSYKIKQMGGQKLDERGAGGLEIAIPVRIRSRAFQTIFGGDRVSLTVTGQININGGLRHEKRSQAMIATTRGSNYNFKMQQTQQFKVQGNVGDKVTVSVDQDSERPFDFENTVRLNYEGYDDEIIQSIQAGNISLSLPATRFVSFSAQNSGLFGIKSEAQIGNFHLTTIASQEKGENKSLKITGGAEEGENTIRDYSYMKGVYFFVDHIYREQYTKLDTTDWVRTYDPQKRITQFELYRSGTGYELKQGRIRGWAIADHQQLAGKDTLSPGEKERNFWIRLEQQKDYFLWDDQGKIKLYIPVSDDDMLAVAYKTADGDSIGDVNFNPLTQTTVYLKLLKPRNPRPSDSTWDLMLRNIYYLGGRNIEKEGFEVKIFYDTPSGNDEETIQTEDGVRSFLSIFGFDRVDQSGGRNPDNVIDDNSFFIRLGEGELEFPNLKPFIEIPVKDLGRPDLKCAIYDTTNQSYISSQSKFYIQVKSKNRSANYDLGWNVIDGSEEVILNGRKLAKDTDYIIDYYSGKLTILREEATNPAANIEVNYQRNELFQLEKKTLIGTRGQYNFWDKSFIGGTLLYLSQSTLDQKVRVGKGPMRNLIWDVNTALNFESSFVTKLIDAFPIIETKQPSKFNFEGEIAQILPNPNTLNNENTNDPDGVAYIDDFEAAKRITPLGVIRSGWRPSSSPFLPGQLPDPQNNYKNTFDIYKRRGLMIWTNPYNQVPIQTIWPNRDVNPQTPQSVHVLDIFFKPQPKDSVDDVTYTPEQSWNGIMRWLSSGYADQSDSKFLEVWVYGNSGRIHLDLGQISEDVIPNGSLDTEDKLKNGIRNQLLDQDEDVGIDGMAGADPFDFWDINKNGVRDPGEPLSYDDWQNIQTGSIFDLRESLYPINGTENNKNDPGGSLPDTEDLNGNGSLDVQNHYFEYTFSLEDTVFLAGGNPKGWRMYRIPLDKFSNKVGEPDRSRIDFARIWIDNCKTDTWLRIAEINLVGNDWKEMGVALDDSSAYDASYNKTVVAAVINTHDNPTYVPPPGVSGVRDRITRVEAKEQSLVISINELAPGTNGILRKTFFQAEDYIHYEKMKMFIHGGDTLGSKFDKYKTSIEMFLRFGSDDNNYYEYRAPVFQGWENNDMEIDLNEIAKMKSEGREVMIDSTTGRQYRVVGKPSLTNIRQLVLGVKNISNSDSKFSSGTNNVFSGEIWVNELRLSGVRKDKGIAVRARADLQFADVLSINGEVNRKDADFHNVSERFGMGSDEIGGTFSGNLSIHKFLPKSWGLLIPINFNYTERTSTPKYLPGSDVLAKTLSDSLLDLIRAKNNSKGFGVSFKKNTRSNNFFIKNTLDQISLSYNWGVSNGTSSTHFKSYQKTEAANFSYAIPFPRDKYIRPLQWLGKAPIIKKLAETQFNYLPSSFNIRISGNRSSSEQILRTGLTPPINKAFLISRSIQTGISPFKSFSIDFSRSYKNDLRDLPNPRQQMLNMKNFLKYNFGDSTNLTDMDQSLSTKYNPQFFSWLKTNFSYSTQFRWTNNIQLQDRGRSATNNTSFNGSFTFEPDRLIKSIFKQPSKAQPPRGARTAPAAKQPEKKDEKPEEKKDQAKPSFNPLKPLLSGIQFFTSRIQPITMSITQSQNLSHFGLSDSIRAYPTVGYMFGMDDDPGMGHVPNIGTNKQSLRQTSNLSLSSGISVIKQVDVNLKYNYSKNENSTTMQGGDATKSWFPVEKNGKDAGFVLPEWSLRWSGIERIKFLNKFAQRISFDHSFTGNKQDSWQKQDTDTMRVPTRESYTKSFRPLAGLNITLKNNISLNLRYNWSETLDLTTRNGSGGTKNLTSDFSLSGQYSKSGGFRLPFFKNKELKNTMDVQLTVSWNKNEAFQNVSGGDWTTTRDSEQFNFEPKLTYSFSQNVRGGANFKWGYNTNERIGKTSIMEFGIHVNIIISGR